LPTDSLVFELQQNAGAPWLPYGDVAFNTYFGSYYFGASLNLVSGSSTDVDVRFGNSGAGPGAAYAGLGSSWSGAAATYRWRVKVIRGGAQVGYPISSANIVGRTDGNAPATGMVGQSLTIIQSAFGSVGTSGQVFDVGSTINVTDGIWLASYMLQWRANSATITAADLIGGFSSTSGNSFTGMGVCNSNETFTVAAAPTNSLQTVSASGIVCRVSGGTLTLPDATTLTASTIYFKAYGGTYSAGTPQVRGYLTFIRIA
jgi:hypothetical protein